MGTFDVRFIITGSRSREFGWIPSAAGKFVLSREMRTRRVSDAIEPIPAASGGGQGGGLATPRTVAIEFQIQDAAAAGRVGTLFVLTHC